MRALLLAFVLSCGDNVELEPDAAPVPSCRYAPLDNPKCGDTAAAFYCEPGAVLPACDCYGTDPVCCPVLQPRTCE